MLVTAEGKEPVMHTFQYTTTTPSEWKNALIIILNITQKYKLGEEREKVEYQMIFILVYEDIAFFKWITQHTQKATTSVLKTYILDTLYQKYF